MSDPLVVVGLALVGGYLLGSIPFGLVLTRLAGGPDIRTVGSGNIGATNVLRTGNKPLAAATLLLDTFKGTVAVLVAKYYGGADAAIAAGLMAFLGHVFPVWLGFKGGKGVATYIGILLGLAWPLALGFCLVWLAVAATTRYSSLSALVASALAPVAAWVWTEPRLALLAAVLTVVLWIKHRPNIERLIAGTESRIGSKSKTAG